MGTALKDFKIKESYARLIEKALFSYFYEGVFKPILEALSIPLKAINADEDVITKALLKGSIVYEQNGFKAIDKFTNAQSKLLQKWGAVWDKWSKSWKLPYSKLPQHILVAIAANRNLTQRKVDYLKKFLEELQANWETAVQTMTFHEEVMTVLDDAGNEIQKVFKRVNVITPELSEEDKQEISRTYTNNMNFYIKSFGDERIPLMREKVQEIVLNGGRFQEVEKMLNREFEVWGNKAKFLAQNETNIMLAELKKVEYQKQGFDMFIWRTITDGRERELHRHLNGRVFRYDDPPIIDLRTGQRGLPGQTYNCLTGDMVIISPFLQNRIFKRKFTGETTELVLPMGRLKVTPNHPILTDRGWVAAKDINIGDHIAKISDKTFLAASINPNDVKITIEEFFGFYSVLFDTQRVSHSDFDFHGDVSVDKQVDVININGKLGNYFKSDFNQLVFKQILAEADNIGISSSSDRTFYQAFPFCTSSSDRIISSLSKIFSFFFSSEFHSVEHRLRAVAWLDTLLYKSCGYSTSADSEFLSKLFNAPTGSIKLYQLVLWDICFNCFRKNIISSLLHSDREVSCATSETLSNLSQTKPAFVEFDTVIDKIISKSSNIHIYNLENSNHWYLTCNYITKNCRCEAIPYTENTPFKHTFIDETGKEREVIDYNTSKQEMDIWRKAYDRK